MMRCGLDIEETTIDSALREFLKAACDDCVYVPDSEHDSIREELREALAIMGDQDRAVQHVMEWYLDWLAEASDPC